MNLGLQDLESLEEFICKIVTGVAQSDVLEALAAKIRPLNRRWKILNTMDSSWQRDCPLEGDSFPAGQKGDSNEVRLK